MQVVFTGQSGIKKSIAIKRLIEKVEPDVGKIDPLCIEDYIKESFLDIVPFLEERA